MGNQKAIVLLTFTTLWANSADDKLIFSYFYPKTGFDISCELVLNEMPKPVSLDKIRKYFSSLSAENFTHSAIALTCVLLNPDRPCLANIIDPDQWLLKKLTDLVCTVCH